MLLYIAVGLLAACYAGLFLFCARRWKHVPEQQNGNALEEGISIVVPFRNEADNLPSLLAWLQQQEYAGKAEVLLIDDHSEDGAAQICLDFIRSQQLGHWRLLGAEGEGKKAALAMGIRAAQFPWILSTDADCTGSSRWLQRMAAAGNGKINLVSGPVRFRDSPVWMASFQQVESAGLIAIGGCSLDAGLPSFCNGANLMFRKSAWEMVNGYAGHAQLASGDDELLMHALAARFPGSLVFQKSLDACVETAPQASRKAFLEQRKRWLSKGHAHPLHVKVMRYAIGAFYLLLICTFLLAPWLGGWPVFGFACAIWLLKTSAEWFFYRSILPFFRLEAGWLQLLGWQPWQVLYPVYLALSPGSKRFSWKNRHYF